MEELISVIVPIYNVEKYLERCVDSIIKQTYKNLEIILVDDGSPDNCGAICDEYALKDNRIKVIHKNNGGLSSARNAGLNVATGKYVSFIDSDDWIEPEMYENLFNKIKNYNCEVCLVSVKDEPFKEDITVSINELIKGICFRKIPMHVWGGIFDRKLFNNVRFNEKRLNEDFLLWVDFTRFTNLKIVYLSYVGYNYFIRENSISSSFGKSMVDAVYNSQEAINTVKENSPKLEKYCRGYNAYQARTALIVMPQQYAKEHKDFEKFCIKCLKENLKFADKSLIKIKDKLFCRLYFVFPKLAKFIVKSVGKK